MDTAQVDPFSSALAMLDALNRRTVSAQELLQLHLRRIERYNPALNAIVIPNFEEAWEAARAADHRRASAGAPSGAMLGLPVTIKDCIYVRNLPTTGGVAERAGAISEVDAQLTARVRGAGAVIIGKTNVPPYASDWQSNNPVFGRSNNPWNLGRTPGGSTGGGAAAVAAGLSPLEFGGDFAGSIRIPAAFCGIYGHKPSETALPRSGHFPAGPLPNWAAAMAVQGPLARTAGDLDLALRVVAGPEVGEDVAWRLNLPGPRQQSLSHFRVAVLPIPEWVPVDPGIRATLETVTGVLRAAGARVEIAQPEEFGDLHDFFDLYTRLLFALSSGGGSQEARQAAAAKLRQSGYEPAAEGFEASAWDYVRWHGEREAYRAAYRKFFRDWDVLLAPVTIVNAFPHTDAPFSRRQHIVEGRTVRYDFLSFFASLANLPGQPATAFPAGRSDESLPIGIQAIGPYLEDRTTIRFAELLAERIGGFAPPFGYTS